MANWDEISLCLTQSPNKVKIYKPESDGRQIIEQIGISEHSVIGLIILNCSMVQINGYLRIWGSGNNSDHRNFLESNNEFKELLGGNKLIIADDIWGGCFAISNGDFSDSPQYIWYYAPDSLQWENLENTYSQFVFWAASSNIQDFYKGFLWDSIVPLLDEITFDKGISIYPPLWSKECDSHSASIKLIPTKEIVAANVEMAKQLDG